MEAILQDISQPGITQAVRANLNAFLGGLPALPVPAGFMAAGLRAWTTAIPHPWFNGVLAARPPAAGAWSLVEQAIHAFQGRGVEAFTWWLDPPLESSSWQSLLEAAGLQLSTDTPGMAMDLECLQDASPLPAGVNVRQVDSPASLHEWVRTFLPGYELPSEWGSNLYDLLASLGLDLPNRHYLAILDGQPAAASSLFLGAGVAGIYNVATLPAWRGRGLGTLLTRLPLLEACRLGYRVGVLQSSEQGFPVYQKLGFRQVCTMDHFYWRG